ncbi:MAG: sensor histidine kinase [Lacibacter sp.]
MKLKILFILFICCLQSKLHLHAQITKADSLRKVINSEKDEVRKMQELLLLAIEYRNINPDSLLNLSETLIALSEKNHDESMKMKAEINKVFYYLNTSQPDSGLLLSTRNIRKLNNKSGNDSLLAQYHSAAGLSLMRLNRQKDAMENFFTALKKAEKAGDKIAVIKQLHNVGWAYMELNQYNEAITHFTTAIKKIEDGNFYLKFAPTYNNLASCYGAVKKYDSLYKFAKLAIGIAKSQNNYAAEANGWNILGTAYSAQEKFTEALNCFLKAKPLREKVGDPFFIVSDLAVLSELYANMNRPADGLFTGKEALKIAEQTNMQAKLPMIYKAIALNYEKAANYSEAAFYYKKINDLKDTLYTNASQEAMAEMQTKYETEKKERVIQEQQFKLKQKNYLIIAVSCFLLLSILLAWLIYNRNKLKERAKLQEAIMQQQQIAAAAILQAEENERQRIAKDLHDGVGQMMSAAKMNLSAFENNAEFRDEEQKNSFDRIISLVDESCKEVRTVSHQMMPNVLLKAGLGKAVHNFLDKIDQKVLKINLYTEGLNDPIDENIEIVLYRVLQESVNNVIKHAGATELDISLVKEAGGVSATIEDNGKGFDSTHLSEKAGIGLKNMRARVEYLKGTIDFDAAPGKGTLVAIFIPFNKELNKS